VPELQALIEEYLRRERSARDLFRGIQAFAIPLTADDAEPAAKRLYNRTWLLLMDRSEGDRTDRQVRRALLAEVRRLQRRPPFPDSILLTAGISEPVTAMFTASVSSAAPVPLPPVAAVQPGVVQGDWHWHEPARTQRHGKQRLAAHGSTTLVPT
jgi:hypothetical protein